MKTYRVGELSDIFGFIGWGIQEKKWWGWRTLTVYTNKDNWLQSVKRLKENKNCIVL